MFKDTSELKIAQIHIQWYVKQGQLKNKEEKKKKKKTKTKKKLSQWRLRNFLKKPNMVG